MLGKGAMAVKRVTLFCILIGLGVWAVQMYYKQPYWLGWVVVASGTVVYACCKIWVWVRRDR